MKGFLFFSKIMMNGNNKCPQYRINLASPFRFDFKGAECSTFDQFFTTSTLMWHKSVFNVKRQSNFFSVFKTNIFSLYDKVQGRD